MSKVFVVQIQKKYVRTNGIPKLVNSVDVTPAKQFGEIIELVPEHIAETGDEIVIRDHIYDVLEEHYAENDFILPVGSPIFIGVACAILTDLFGGKIKFLVWDRRKSVYEVKTYHI